MLFNIYNTFVKCILNIKSDFTKSQITEHYKGAIGK